MMRAHLPARSCCVGLVFHLRKGPKQNRANCRVIHHPFRHIRDTPIMAGLAIAASFKRPENRIVAVEVLPDLFVIVKFLAEVAHGHRRIMTAIDFRRNVGGSGLRGESRGKIERGVSYERGEYYLRAVQMSTVVLLTLLRQYYTKVTPERIRPLLILRASPLASLHGEKLSVSRPSFALRQWAFERFNKLNGVANVAVHLHDHFDVGVLDPVSVDKIRHAKDDRGLFVPSSSRHQATFFDTAQNLVEVAWLIMTGRKVRLITHYRRRYF